MCLAGKQPIHEITLNGIALAISFNSYFIYLVQAVNVTSSDNSDIHLNNISESIFLLPTCDREVATMFTNMKNGKSLDINNMQVKPIKYVLYLLAPILNYI